MSALVVLIAASLLLALGFLIAFILATKKGQYEDVYTPAVRILFEPPLSGDDLKPLCPQKPDISPQGGEKNASVVIAEIKNASMVTAEQNIESSLNEKSKTFEVDAKAITSRLTNSTNSTNKTK